MLGVGDAKPQATARAGARFNVEGLVTGAPNAVKLTPDRPDSLVLPHITLFAAFAACAEYAGYSLITGAAVSRWCNY
jgi:hypothetical protein